MEAALVWRLAIAQWQLRRSLTAEALMFESVIIDAQCDLAAEDATLTSASISHIDWSASQLDEKDIETRHKLEQEMKQLIQKRPYLEAKLSKNKDEQRKRIGNLGAVFYHLSGNQGGIMAVLRYRTACEGIYYRALLTLERLQTNRKSGSEPIE
jgi:hypothetical protein